MTLDPKGRTTPGFERHAFICGHTRVEGATRPSCEPKGSIDLMRSLKMNIREAGIKNVRVQKSGCLDHCEYGPTCVVYPEGIWYGLVDDNHIQALLKHLKTGEVDEAMTLKMDE